MDIGKAIREIRKALGIRRKELAASAGISVTALYNIEKNLSFPSKSTSESICRALGVPVGFLLVFCVTEEDVPQKKRQAFRCLIVPVKTFLLQGSVIIDGHEFK